MKHRYVVLPVEGSEGIEFLAESPVNRRIYGPGDVIELDDAVHAVAGLTARGQIRPLEEPTENKPAATDASG